MDNTYSRSYLQIREPFKLNQKIEDPEHTNDIFQVKPEKDAITVYYTFEHLDGATPLARIRAVAGYNLTGSYPNAHLMAHLSIEVANEIRTQIEREHIHKFDTSIPFKPLDLEALLIQFSSHR